MGGLLCALYFVAKTAFFTLLGTVATALFWGIWIVSEVPKIIRAFEVKDPSRWIHLAKFLAALVIFGALTLAHMIFPVGPVALLVSAILGGLYILSQYKCNQAIAAHTEKLDMERAPAKPTSAEIELADLKRMPTYVSTGFFIPQTQSSD